MAIRPYYLAPWVPSRSSYGLQIYVAPNAYALTLTLDPGQEYWASGDGAEQPGEQDLCKILEDAFAAATPWELTTSISTDGRLVFTSTVDFEVRWASAVSTLPPEIFGFCRDTFTTTSFILTAPFTPRGAWLPGRCAKFDSEDVPQYVAASQVTGSGEGRGYRLGESSRREMTFALLESSRVLGRHAKDAIYESGEWQALTEAMRYWVDGSRIRIYDDHQDRDDYRVYRLLPGDMPRPMGGMLALRYEVQLRFRSSSSPFVSASSFDFSDTGYLSLESTVDSADDLFSAVEQVSWSLWVCPDKVYTLTDGSAVLIARDGHSSLFGERIWITLDGEIGVRLAANITSNPPEFWLSDTGLVAIGEWAHIVAVFDASASGTAKLRVYVNGVNVTSGGAFGGSPGTWAKTALVSNGLPLIFGQNAIGTWRLDGRLDEVAIFHYPLTADDAAEIYNSGVPRSLLDLTTAPSPVAWWRAEGDILDSSGEQRHLVGSPTGYGEPAVGA